MGIDNLKEAQDLVGSFGTFDMNGLPDKGDEYDLSGIDDKPTMTVGRALGALYYPGRQMLGANASTILSYRKAVEAKHPLAESMGEALDPFAEDYARIKGEAPTQTVFHTEYGRFPVEAKIRVNTRADELRANGMPEYEAWKQSTFEEIKAQQKRINSDLQAVADATKLPEEFKQSSGLAEDVLRGVSSVGVSIPEYVAFGPFIQGLLNYSQMHGIKVQELEDMGVSDPAQILKAGIVSGAGQAPLETLSNLFVVSRVMKANGSWKNAMLRIGESMVGDGATEYAQQYPDELATLLALNPDASVMDISRHMDLHADEYRESAAYAGLVGTLTGGVAGGGGVTVSTAIDKFITSKQKTENAKTESRIELLANKESMAPEEEAELRGLVNLAEDADVKAIIKEVKKQFEISKPIQSERREAALKFHEERQGPEQAQDNIAIMDAMARSWAEREGKKPAEFYDRIQFEGEVIDGAVVGTEGDLFQAANTNTENFKTWFRESKVKDETGNPLQVFHGTRRPDRIGDRFMKSRATSGPMAFFTDDADIASKYGLGKEDTSLVVDSLEQFFYLPDTKGKPKAKGLKQIWWNLTEQQRQSLRDNLPKIGTNEETGDIELTEDGGLYPSGWDYEVKRNGGNWLMAANEIWLLSGTIYNNEEQFTKVLKLAGVDGVEYDDPYAQKSAVIPVFLSIQTPLVTSEIPQSVIDALEKKSRRVRNKPENATGDTWDKNRRDPRGWMEELKKDYAAGKNSFVWTSMPDWVTKVLKDFGYDGIHDTGGKMGGQGHDVWIPFEENQVKSSIGNRGTYDPKSKSILRQGERGKITLKSDTLDTVIKHFQNADASTTIHELGHFITNMLWQQGDSDYLTLAEHAGVDHERALAGIGGWTKEEHETVAKSFEVYLMEGRSPSQKLQQVFARMKAWLLEVYKSVTSLGVELNDDVRGVFDRLLTTEIERAENPILEVQEWFNVDEITSRELGRRALDTAAASEMEYDDIVARAREMVVADRKKKKAGAEKKMRAEMMREAQASIETEPFYAMLDEILKNGGMKQSVIEGLYDSGWIQSLQLQRPGIVSKNGISPDIIGEQFGYESIDAMVQDILYKPSKKEAVQTYFDGLWGEYQRYEHLSWAETLEDSINAEIEMINKLSRKEGNKPKPARGLKKVIRENTGIVKTEELKQLAEDLKRDAQVARKAWNEARKAMRDELVPELQAEKREAVEKAKQEAIEKIVALREAHADRINEIKFYIKEEHRREKYIRQIKKIMGRKSLSPEYRSQIATLVSEYMDVAPKYQGEAPTMDFSAFVESKRESEGDYITDWLLEEYGSRPAQARNKAGYRVPLTADEWESVNRIVRMMEYLDRGTRMLLDATAKLDHERTVSEKVKRIFEVWGDPGDPEHPLDIITKRERFGWFTKMSDSGKQFLSNLLKCEFIFDALDGWKAGGPNAALNQAINNAFNSELLTGSDFTNKLTSIFSERIGKDVSRWSQLLHEVQGVAVKDPRTGKMSRMLTKEQMIAIALNSGNDGNLTALREGNGLTDAQIQSVFDALTDNEKALVDDVWKLLDTIYPLLNEVHTTMTGVNLKRVEGRYYPMVFNRELSVSADKFSEQESAKNLMYGAQVYHRPSVKAGHRMTRKGGKLGLDLSLGVLSKHIVNTVHDITHSVPVRDVQKIIADPAYREAVSSTMGEQVYKQLMPWLSNLARPIREPDGGFNIWAGRARKASTTVGLGFRVSTMLQQWTALFPTIGTEGFLPVMQAVGKFYAHPQQMADFINEADPRMMYRKESFSQELAQFRDTFGSKFFKGHSAITNAAFYCIELFDAMVRYPTWLASYTNSMKDSGNDHQASVEAAAKTVSKTQGWGSEKDLSMWQRGGKTRSEFVKLLYMFSTYFNTFANNLWETKTRYQLGNISFAHAARSYFWVMILPAMIGGILNRRRLPEGAEWLTDQVKYMLGGIPIVRDVANPILNIFTRGPVDYQMSPVERIPQKAAGLVQHLASDKEGSGRAAAMDALELSGYLFRLPTGQATVTMDGLIDLMEGTGTAEGLFFRPEKPKSLKPKKPKKAKPSL